MDDLRGAGESQAGGGLEDFQGAPGEAAMGLLHVDVAGGDLLLRLAGQVLVQGGLVGFDGEHVVDTGGEDRGSTGGLGVEGVGGDDCTGRALAQRLDHGGQRRYLGGLGLDLRWGHHRPRHVVEAGDQVAGPLGGRAGAR